MNKKVEILDCTLRDASYAIAYQFTAEDTAVIAAGLESAGFTKIEIGHGLGLAGSTPTIGLSAATDEEYLEAAGSVLTKAKFGMFLIPGIAKLEHVKLAAKYKCGFIRIGTDANRTEAAEEFIKLSKDLGMEVSANLMKTYAVPVDEVVRRSELLQQWGSDVISVVDSAGGMLPEEVTAYVSALVKTLTVAVGFHGHNNMQLAVANSLAAVHAGAIIVDGTLRGMGRSSGNAQTEVLVMALSRMGYETGIDFYKAMNLGDKLIGPLAQGRGVDSVELASGYACFHSTFNKIIDKVSSDMDVDKRKLIIKVSEIDKIMVTDKLAISVAEKIKAEKKPESLDTAKYTFNLEHREARLPDSVGTADLTRKIASEMSILAKKMSRSSVFTISFFAGGAKDQPVFPFIRWNALNIVGNAEVQNLKQAVEIANSVDGQVDFIIVDGEQQSFPTEDVMSTIAAAVKKSQLLTYRDTNAHLDAAEAFVSQLCKTIKNSKIAICGLSGFGLKLAHRLLERGATVQVWDEDRKKAKQAVSLLSSWISLEGSPFSKNVSLFKSSKQELDMLIGTSLRNPVVQAALVASVKKGGFALDAGVGSVTTAAIEAAVASDLQIFRLDMRAGLSGQINTATETLELLKRVIGHGKVADVNVVAGGVIGKRGTIVVDTISHPTRVLGVADGGGHLLKGSELMPFQHTIDKVRVDLIRRRLQETQTSV